MTGRQPVWPTCEVCEQPITEDRDATLSIRPANVGEYLAAKQEWEAQYVTKTESGGEIVTGAVIVAHPAPIH